MWQKISSKTFLKTKVCQPWTNSQANILSILIYLQPAIKKWKSLLESHLDLWVCAFTKISWNKRICLTNRIFKGSLQEVYRKYSPRYQMHSHLLLSPGQDSLVCSLISHLFYYHEANKSLSSGVCLRTEMANGENVRTWLQTF